MNVFTFFNTPLVTEKDPWHHYLSRPINSQGSVGTTYTQGFDLTEVHTLGDLFDRIAKCLPPGKAHVAYIPNGRMVGISKLARVVDAYARRLQVQERLTAQIADAIHGVLQPQGTAVILQCQHFCMCYRGVKKPGSWTTTSRLHGSFMLNPATRSELFTLIGLKQQVG